MISKKYIKEMDFKNIEDIYNYVLESEINGQRKQVKNLIRKMSKAQKKECINFLDEVPTLTEDKKAVLEILLESL